MIDQAVNTILAAVLFTLACGGGLAVVLWLANQSRP